MLPERGQAGSDTTIDTVKGEVSTRTNFSKGNQKKGFEEAGWVAKIDLSPGFLRVRALG